MEQKEMMVADFDYFLPEELIAQTPLLDRPASRLLVLDKTSGKVTHKTFRDILDYIQPGDCLVLNNTKVIPARLYGEREDTLRVRSFKERTGGYASRNQRFLRKDADKTQVASRCYRKGCAFSQAVSACVL